MKRELRRFTAKSDAGKPYTVVEYGHISEFRPLSGGREERIGALEYFLEDGRDVSATSEPAIFRIVENDEVIRET